MSLTPCPFCGFSAVQMRLYKGGYRGTCVNVACMAEGPPDLSYASAVESWDRRADPIAKPNKPAAKRSVRFKQAYKTRETRSKR